MSACRRGAWALAAFLAAACREDGSNAVPEAARADRADREPTAETAESPTSAAADWRTGDARLVPWLTPAAREGHYDVETADVGAVLIATLSEGQREPLRRAREELAFGPAAERERLLGLFTEHFGDPHREALLSNVLDVALLAEDEILVPVLRRALEHPTERIRILGLRGLRRFGTPADFERVLGRLELAQFAEFDAALATLLHTDRERYERVLATWLDQGMLGPRAPLVARDLARAETPELLATAARLLVEDTEAARAAASLGPYLLAALAQSDAASRISALAFDPLARLHQLASEGSPAQRSSALDAAAAAGCYEVIEARLRAETDDAIRMRALNLALDPDVGPTGFEGAAGSVLRAELVRALDARDAGLRELALGALVLRGDAQAIDRALLLVESGGEGRDQALAALRPRFADDPALVQRLLAILGPEEQARRGLPAGENRALYEALGSLPDAGAAARVVEASKTAQGSVAGLRAHRWLVLRASNGGRPAHDVLRAALATERDPIRRLDLLEALTAPGTDFARETALELVQLEDGDPFERLFLASRLAAIGPARTVLPVLKRVCLQIREPAARTGFQRLLWHWYPRP